MNIFHFITKFSLVFAHSSTMILVKIICLKDALVDLPKIIMSLNQLIWITIPKIMSSGAITVGLAACIAAALFNEDSHSLLFFLKSIEVEI